MLWAVQITTPDSRTEMLNAVRVCIVEASLQVPVIQDLNGTALETDYAATLGFRFRF